jgi:hypothetical protein
MPPASQSVESEAQVESEFESQPESTASNAQDPVSFHEASPAPLQAEGSTEDSSAATVDYSDSPIFITKELPSYLDFYTSQRDPNSKRCMNPFDLLSEMRTLERNEASDARTENSLKGLLEPHPLGFPVTITCGGGICQISELGPYDRIRERTIEHDRYWGELQQRVYRLDPIASELVTLSVSYAPYPEDTSQEIAALILTTKARVITDESLDCPLHNVSKRK